MSTERESPAFLNTDPPHWGARGVAYILILLFVVAAVATLVIRVPETVSCPFVLVPREGTDPIRASRDGFVVEVRAAEAQAVREGDALFVIRSDAAGDRSGELATLRIQLQGAEESLTNAQKKYDKQRQADEEDTRKLEARVAQLTRKIEGTQQVHKIQQAMYETSLGIAEKAVDSINREAIFKRKARELAQDIVDKAAKLYSSKAMSELEYLQLRLEADKRNLDVEQIERELDATKLKVTQHTAQHQSQKTEGQMTLDQLATDHKENETALTRLRRQMEIATGEQAELERSAKESMARIRLRIDVLSKELEHSQGGEVLVTAPRTGTVLRLQVKGSGAFVRTGDVLCELAGEAERLQAELTVPQSRMGRISPEQRVKLLYDAFPYQRHGVRFGTVRWVSPAGVEGKDSAAFRVLVDNDDEAIWADGQARPLRAGMGGRAEVVVGRGSLISYAFDPLRQVKENLAEPPAKGGP